MKGVSKYYEGGFLKALENISLTVESQEWLTIMGPSGSGKSTLLHLMAGLDLPSQGQVLFEGNERRSKAAWTKLRSRKIGFIFQTFNLLPTLNTIENAILPMYGVVKGYQEKRSRASELLKQVGLTGRALHYPNQLSAGERQRLAIARSLANKPSLLLADEPTGNLDSQNKINLMALLKEIQSLENLTLVLVTHDTNLVEYSDRMIRLVDGHII